MSFISSLQVLTLLDSQCLKTTVNNMLFIIVPRHKFSSESDQTTSPVKNIKK